MNPLDDWISGERFASLADGERIVYRKRDELTPLPATARVLITHNSDWPVTHADVEKLPNVRWYGQNLTAPHRRAHALPIGLANARWPYGDIEVWRRASEQPRTRHNLVYKNWTMTTPERLDVWGRFRQPWVTAEAGRTPDQYAADLRAHPFVLCPEGAGVDTHRIWESLYMGAIPVCLWTPALWHFHDLPILFLNDWSELTESLLINRLKEQPREWSWRKLTLSYWRERIHADSAN